MNTTATKRKRTKNTSNDQLEIYLTFMEEDYIFRSGTVNPTVSPNYITNKWEEISNKLNSVGDGPQLSSEEWKKRFLDWKYSTKSKYRKMQSHCTQTGSGPPSKLTLNPLEERGLSVWGKVTVAGAPGVTLYEGIPINTTAESNLTTAEENIEIENNNELIEQAEFIYLERTEESTATPNKSFRKQKRVKPKPLSTLAENLIENSKNWEGYCKNLNANVEKFVNTFETIEKEKLEVEKKRLNFEICKFKYLHPDFNFENDL
ncbi:hypothetical protein RN001_005535 [Aquatica leii]|uniref:Regulatory protein zeste n=1 Tax=Aquatica leii TaxID=1421715 RepID=A0AAN7PK06_9COLE|nr:hypothetical protein RN001_005535 [Aquatica leii]